MYKATCWIFGTNCTTFHGHTSHYRWNIINSWFVDWLVANNHFFDLFWLVLLNSSLWIEYCWKLYCMVYLELEIHTTTMYVLPCPNDGTSIAIALVFNTHLGFYPIPSLPGTWNSIVAPCAFCAIFYGGYDNLELSA